MNETQIQGSCRTGKVESDFGLHGTTPNPVTVRADSTKDVDLHGIEQKEVEALGFEPRSAGIFIRNTKSHHSS